MEEIHAVRCIWCGGEMERGSLICHRTFFLTAGETIPRFDTAGSVEKRNGFHLVPQNVVPIKPEEFPTAYVCRNCRKIVIPY